MPYAPNPDSNRSKKRKVRGFVSLEKSSRKHRRMMNRQLIARNQYGKIGEPGSPMGDGVSFIHKAGGKQRYH